MTPVLSVVSDRSPKSSRVNECPICGSYAATPLLEKPPRSYVRCVGCGLARASAQGADYDRGLAHLDGLFAQLELTGDFECARDPRDLLRRARRHLTRGGSLHVQIPNPRSLDARLAGAAWFAKQDPSIESFFEARHLRELLIESGFEVVSLHAGPLGLGSAIDAVARAVGA